MRNFSCYFRTTIIKSAHIPSVCRKNAAKPRRRERFSSPANAKQPTPSPYPDQPPPNSGKPPSHRTNPRRHSPPKARKKAPASRRGRHLFFLEHKQLAYNIVEYYRHYRDKHLSKHITHFQVDSADVQQKIFYQQCQQPAAVE